MNTTELEIVAPVEEQLSKFAGSTGLEQSSTTPLVEAFRPIFIEARKALSAANGVAASVRDATCFSEIKQARACRLAIRRIRIEGEKVKKAQKANALTYGRAVDGFYNILEADLAPVEKALQDAEDTAERAETARKDALESGRKTALAPYVSDPNLYAVRDMPEAAFTELLNGVRVAQEQVKAAAAKVEADRIEREKAEAAERERIRQDNERLRQEAIVREAAAKAEREAAEKKLAEERAEAIRIAAEAKAKADAEAKAARAKADMERAAVEAKARAEREIIEEANRQERLKAQALREVERQKEQAERAAADKKASEARAAQQKAESELQARHEAELKQKAAEEAARKKAANAGDAEKLSAYATAIERATPTLKNEALQQRVLEKISELIGWLKEERDAL